MIAYEVSGLMTSFSQVIDLHALHLQNNSARVNEKKPGELPPGLLSKDQLLD